MKSIPSEPLDIYVVISENVTIEAVVVPAFKEPIIFHVLFEKIDYPMRVSIVVNKETRTGPKVDIRTSKTSRTNYLPMPYRRLLLDLDVYSLCVPRMYSVTNLIEHF